MKSLYRIFIMAFSVACILCGCDKSDLFEDAVQTASVRLSIPLLGSGNVSTKVEGTAEENAIKTLRVVILSQVGGSWTFNKLYSESDLTQSGSQILIENVPVGEVQIYVIVNEASIGKTYDDLSVLQGDVVTVGNSRKLLIMDTAREYFPKRQSEFPEGGLPMGWMTKSLMINPPADTPQVIDVELERQVAKLNINMHNALTSDITITDVNFGPFFNDRFYFFREETLDVPNDAVYAPVDYTGLNINVEAGKTKALVCYVYPSFAWKNAVGSSPYTIGFKTAAGVLYPPQTFIGDENMFNSILRNTQINIHASLTASSNVVVHFSVEPWTEYTSDVPAFE